MKNCLKFLRNFGLGLALLITATSTPTLAQPETEIRSNPPPNITLNVVRRTGTCPRTVGLWTISLGYREIPGAETVVIANTLAIAGPVQLSASRFRFVEYRATLQPAYASCVGEAISRKEPNTLDARYRFRFENENVYFSVDLTDTPEGFGAGISEEKVVGLRPLVVWSFID